VQDSKRTAAFLPPFSYRTRCSDIIDDLRPIPYIRHVRKPILLLVSGLILTFANSIMAQSAERDFRLIINGQRVSEYDNQREEDSPVAGRSELGIAGSGLIRLYQTLISSQDSPACNFTPSCSRFTAAAIRKAGFVRGTLLGADRLLRCHRWTKRQYLKTHNLGVDQSPMHIYDPPERYID
jgi:putative membrane protein insertion efficiency factor